MRPQSALAICLNLAVATLSLCIGGWAAFNLGALLLDPIAFEINLMTLPAVGGGSARVKLALFVVACVLTLLMLGWSVMLVLNPRSARLSRWNGVIVVNLALGLLLLEGCTRALDDFGLMKVKTYAYFANPYCGETLSRLAARTLPPAFGFAHFDSEIGWVHSADFEDGIGLPWPPSVDARPKAWFFGDSFMQGAGSPDHSVPAVFEALRANRQAMNFGMQGYGVDQIWLSYRRVADRIPSGDPVFVGVLTVDVDRTVLRYFGADKPRYVNVDGRFELEPPLRGARSADDDRSGIGSYAWGLIRSFRELVATRFDRSEVTCDAQDKTAISAFAMDQLIAEAKARNHELVWVLFVPLVDVYKARSWRYRFLRDYFASRGQRTVDTLTLLQRRRDDPAWNPASFYIPGDSHLNAAGNRLVGEALAKTGAD